MLGQQSMMEISLGNCITRTKTIRSGNPHASAWEHGCEVATGTRIVVSILDDSQAKEERNIVLKM